MKVSLISGWSNPGGSTLHHIALTNLLNENGFDCTFWGPHLWHLDKCKAKNFTQEEFTVDPDEVLISHFIQTNPKTACRKHILSCHETNLFPLAKMKTKHYDAIQFVSERQRNWQGVKGVIIPPVIEEVKWEAPGDSVAGVVGSIDGHKRTGEAIEMALANGFNKVLLFGEITDLEYFNNHVSKHLESGQAIYMKHTDSRTNMYNMVDAVFSCSKFETYGMVEAECKLAGIPFYGAINDPYVLPKERILEQWSTLLTS